ncbi:acyl carrier protein [Halotalea alkalilenta]|uniref:acyl carrier protein n=1 Tax=Halotalea alkalilenta TaxID=376489 RepID=UPI000694A7F2|nr:acyl carrier protein [Halotalea alkalilenta]
MSTELPTAANDALALVRSKLVELFDLEAADVTLEARLYEDLDIDSIDAVDLIVELKKYTGKRIDPADFKAVRTVGDIVTALGQINQR